MPLTTFYTPNYNVFHFLLQDLPLLNSKPVSELTHFPHGLLRVVFLGVLLNAIVGEMYEPIIDVIERILVIRKSQIALLIKPYSWRTEVLN